MFAARRRLNILRAADLNITTRFEVLLSRHAVAADAVADLVREHDEALWAELSGLRFSRSCPKSLGPDERAACRAGFAQVLCETFVDPVLFFGPVRPRPGDTALDLGAHIGTTAAVLSRLVGPGGSVLAFEPGSAQNLRANIEDNRLVNVEVVELALGARSGEIDFHFGASGIDSTMVAPTARLLNLATRKVKIDTLDHFVRDRGLARVDFIKMDVEGAEEDVLLGARELIGRYRPRWSISSYHRDEANELQHPKLMALLKKLGYRTVAIPGFHIYAW